VVADVSNDLVGGHGRGWGELGHLSVISTKSAHARNRSSAHSWQSLASTAGGGFWGMWHWQWQSDDHG